MHIQYCDCDNHSDMFNDNLHCYSKLKPYVIIVIVNASPLSLFIAENNSSSVLNRIPILRFSCLIQ